MEKKKKAGINTKLLVLIIALIIILGAVIYALSFYGDISDPESLFDEPVPTPPPAADSTPAPTAEPTPTPDPDKVRTVYSLDPLKNGQELYEKIKSFLPEGNSDEASEEINEDEEF